MNKCELKERVIADGIAKLRSGMDPDCEALKPFRLELYQLVESRAQKICVGRGYPDPEGTALEVAEDLCAKLLKRKFMNYREADPFDPWINTVIRNACKEWARREIHRKELLWERRHRLVPLSPSKEPGEALTRDEILPKVREAINKLPPHKREVIRLRFYEGLSRAEAAIKMGVSKQTISNWIFQSLAFLRQVLRRESLTDAA